MATTKTDEKCHNSKDILTRGLLARCGAEDHLPKFKKSLF
jgi:hypothetical protein